MLKEHSVLKKFWTDAVVTAENTKNRATRRGLSADATLYKNLAQQDFNVSFFGLLDSYVFLIFRKMFRKS